MVLFRRRAREFAACLLTALVVVPAAAQERPKLPPDFDKLSPEEKRKVMMEMREKAGVGAKPEKPNLIDDKGKALNDHQTVKPLKPPEDPTRVKATYVLAGQSKEITDGRFYETHLMLSKFEERPGLPVSEERAFAHLLTLAEAELMGFDCSKEEFEAVDPVLKNPALLETTRQGWEKQGITEEMYRRYGMESRTAQKLRDFYTNSQRVTSEDVFALYKQDHFRMKLAYVAFSAAEFAKKMAADAIPEADLRRYWNDDKGAQNQFRTPTTVGAEFVFFDQSAGGSGSGDAAANAEVGMDEALAYYRRHKPRLDGMLTGEQRAQVQPGAKVAPEELKTPFEILRPQIEREIRASGRVRIAFNEAKADPKTDLAALAAKHKLGYAKFDRAERQAFMNDQRFGLQIFGALFNAEVGKLSPDLQSERSVQFFWRVNAKEASRVPEFDEVKDRLPALYVETMANQRALEAAKAARAAIDAAAESEISGDVAKKNADAETSAAAEIKARNITDEKVKEEVRQRHKTIQQQQLGRVRNLAAGRVFEKACRDAGYEPTVTDSFEIGAARPDRASLPVAEGRLSYFKTQASLRTVDLNTVSQVVTDPQLKTHFVYKLIERAEPDFAQISESDELQMRATAERNKGYQVAMRCEYQEIARRLNLETK